MLPVLKAPHGFVHGCRLVQKTLAPFFETHLGILKTESFLRSFASLPRSRRVTETSQMPVRSGWRCSICGLLDASQRRLREHSASVHLGRGDLQRVWRANFSGGRANHVESCSQFLSRVFATDRAAADAVLHLLMFLHQASTLLELGIEPGLLAPFLVAWASSSMIAPKLRVNDVAWSMILFLGHWFAPPFASDSSTFEMLSALTVELSNVILHATFFCSSSFMCMCPCRKHGRASFVLNTIIPAISSLSQSATKMEVCQPMKTSL